MESQSLTLYIDRPLEEVYEFASVPENFPKWASGLGSGLIRKGDHWFADTSQGLAQIRFTRPNGFGILDHYIILPNGDEIYIPMRVVSHDTGTEIIFTLFRREDMSDERFAADAIWVRKDLQSLKKILETQRVPIATVSL